MIITIARQCGCMGDEIGQRLADEYGLIEKPQQAKAIIATCVGPKSAIAKLKILADEYGLTFYNKEHIVKLAKEKGIYDKFPYFFSEIPVNALMHSISSDENNVLLSEARKALYPIIGDGDCVIIGRGANYAFSDRPDKVSVFLSGDKADRIKHIADVHNISERKAKVVVNETDSRRAEFHKYCSNQEWGNAAYYDMCIDETRIGAEGVVGIIKEYINNCMFDK